MEWKPILKLVFWVAAVITLWVLGNDVAALLTGGAAFADDPIALITGPIALGAKALLNKGKGGNSSWGYSVT